MFQYLTTLSLLQDKEQILSSRVAVDGSGRPMVSWVKSDSESDSLNFCRYDGSEWSFNDSNYKVSQVTSGFNFSIIGNDIYFLYSYRDENTNDTVLAYKMYSTVTEVLSEETIIDTGVIDVAHSFIYSSVMYFIYRKGNILYIKNSSGASSFGGISTYSPSTSNLYFASGQRWILVFWSYESNGITEFKSRCFTLIGAFWETEKTVCSIPSVEYSVSCTSNPDGDSPTPGPTYKPFYCSIVYKTDSTLSCNIVQYDVTTDPTVTTPFIKSYSGLIHSYPETLKTLISVYGIKVIFSVISDTLYLMRTNDISIGFSTVSSPGMKLTNDLTDFTFCINSNDFHYLYISDNITYTYAPFSYNSTAVRREFIISDGTETYLENSKIVSIDDYLIKDSIYDKQYDYPFCYVVNESSGEVRFFDITSFRFMSDLSFFVDSTPSRLVFDKQNSRVLYLDSEKMYSYDILISEKTEYLTFNGTDLSFPTDICFDDKEIFLCDPGNNRIIVIDRSSMRYLRIIKNDLMVKPFRVVPSVSSHLYVRGFSISLVPTIFKIQRDSSIVASFLSYDSFSTYLNIDWYKSFGTFSSQKIVFTFLNNKVLCIDGKTGDFWEATLAGYIVYGCTCDEGTGQVYVSAVSSSNNDVVIELEGLTGQVLREIKAKTHGLIMVSGKQYKGAVGSVCLSNPNYSINGSLTANFTAIGESSVVQPVPYLSCSTPETTEVSYAVADPITKHTYEKSSCVDIWHFRHLGVKRHYVSIDPYFTFTESTDGSLIKSPVFCWSFVSEHYVDTFFLSDSNYLKKIAIWKDEKTGNTIVENVDRIEENNVINSVYVFDGRVVVSAGGYLSIYSYESLNRLSSQYFASDLVIYDYRFGFLWAGSKTLGKIWKIDAIDTASFESYQCHDAPSWIEWSDYFSKYVVMCDNSLEFLDYVTGDIETFYDVHDCFIDDISISGQNMAILLRSHEKLPVQSDYQDEAEFLAAVSMRREDRIYVFVPLESEYIYEKRLPYDIDVNSIYFDGETIIALMSNLSNVYINYYNTKTISETSYSYETERKPVGLVSLPAMDSSCFILTDGSILSIVDEKATLLEWQETDDNSLDVENVSLISNGILIKRNRVGKQTGSSSSSSSSSSSGTAEVELVVQVIVGDSPGRSNKWDSGEVSTTKTCILYGGGNNLEPGQIYYVSIKCKEVLGQWSNFDVAAFVMPHFSNFPMHQESSSSSSSNSLVFMDTVYELSPDETINCGSFSEIAIVFTGGVGKIAYLIIGGNTYKIENRLGNFVFDSGGVGEHEFSFIGETFLLKIGGSYYPITWVGDSNIIFLVYSG